MFWVWQAVASKALIMVCSARLTALEAGGVGKYEKEKEKEKKKKKKYRTCYRTPDVVKSSVRLRNSGHHPYENPNGRDFNEARVGTH